jgi:phosphoglycolate phosphatase-like HAD superfamily hydrolase
VTTTQTARLRWPQPPQAVLFDLDGTLADTAGDLGGALNQLRIQRGLDPLPLDLLRPYASAGARGLIGVGLGIQPEDAEFESLRLGFLDAYTRCLADTTVLFDGMAQVLDTLEAKGLPWGVVTNKPHRFTVPVMQGLGLAQRAATLISGDTTAHAKPHPLRADACRPDAGAVRGRRPARHPGRTSGQHAQCGSAMGLHRP